MPEIDKTLLFDVLFQSDIEVDKTARANPEWYSGRHMYGKTCFGFAGTIEDYGKFLVQLANSDEGWDIAWEFAQRVCTDGMGKATIYYFPGIKVTDV